MKGAIKLDKKQRISWGVSFGSLALVAGMVSYLGLSNGDKANNQMAAGQNLPSNNNTNNQQSQDGFNSQLGQDQNQSIDNSVNGDSSSQIDQNDQFFGNTDGSNQFSNGGPSAGHHHGFDTTTGGT
jgi:hypothetical protein